MKLSIIIPAYNSALYIRDCIDSILQISIDKEIIIINDGSIDNTFDIINEYRNIPNILIINQENKGVAYSRNLGIKMASGDYLSFIDSDDFVNISKYENLVNKTIDNQLDIGGGNFVYYYNNRMQKYCRSEELIRQGIISGADHFAISERTGCYMGSMCLYIFRRNFLLDNQLFCDEKVSIYEDAIFMIQALSFAKKVQYFDEDFYYYRQEIYQSRSKAVSYKNVYSWFVFIKTMWRVAEKYKKGNHKFAYSLYSRMLHILDKSKKFEKKNYYYKYIFNIPKYISYSIRIKYLRFLIRDRKYIDRGL